MSASEEPSDKMDDYSAHHETPLDGRKGGLKVDEVEGMTPNQIAEALRASLSDHKMRFWDAIRVYRKAVLWAVVMSFCVVMQSYDTILINSFYALPSFQKTFGVMVPGKPNSYQVQPKWQSGFAATANCGEILGFLVNGWIVDRFGHRRTAIVALSLTTVFIFPLFFANSLGTLLAGELLLNIPLGCLHALVPGYTIEIAPFALRHWGPTYVHLNEVFGHLIGTGILNAFVNNTTEWAWRIPYAVQWCFPIPLIILLIFAPDSPWWLARAGRQEAAIKALDRLNDGSVNSEESLALIHHTIQLEQSLQFGSSLWDLFKGVDRRRSEVGAGIWIAQALCGFALPSGVYFFEVAGLDPTSAFALNVGQYAIAGVATILTIVLLQRFGRRIMLMCGTFGMLAALFTIGCLSLVPNQTQAIVWPQGVLVLVRFFAFGVSTGPMSFLLSSEISSVKLRAKTISLGLFCYTCLTIASNVVSPYILNPTAANLKGKAAWISTGFNVLILIWIYFRVPETKGRTSEELDLLFAKRLPARKFKSTTITQEEQFGEQAATAVIH